MLTGCDFEFILETVTPNTDQILPVADDTMLDGAAEIKDFFIC